ncbi:hypothetical protein J2T09_003777 [Neorhizobium huautlense]|uniref:Uncharacterized protein n=1 Tax=Neorhizobium huautlense TaxID=67774 RepID=A0ABT9PWZ7_9HYPH|nr:hypothetical protein [Neorhizobium huautlense]MDP9839005.1 hypothetical protein [Neorhizobium huautlense]
MSDTILRYVPEDPFWKPTTADAAKAVSLLKSIAPDAETVDAIFEENVVFYHPGEYWSGIKCNACGADAEPWWDGPMNAAFAVKFENLEFTTPCCGAHTSLNDLHYIVPSAFGRFNLEARNPNMGDPTEDHDRDIARCLGAPVRKIWVRL